MSRRSLGTLTLDLVAQIGGFEKGMDKANRKSKKTMGDMQKHANAAAKAVAGIGIAAVGATAAIIKSQANTADELMKTSRAIGWQVEELSALKYGADLSGVELANLTTGMRSFNTVIRDANDGTGKGVDAFDALGISLTDNEGQLKTSRELLNEVADGFAGMEDGITKSAIAADLLGSRAGPQMINLLNDGAAGLAKFKQEAADAGQIIDEKTATGAEAFNDALTKLNKSLTGNYDLLGAATPAMEQFTDLINDPDTIEGLRNLIGGVGDLAVELVELTTTAGRFTQWFAEEVASRLHGPAHDDLVRHEAALDKLQQRYNNVKKYLDTNPLLRGPQLGLSTDLWGEVLSDKGLSDLAQKIAAAKSHIRSLYDEMGAESRKLAEQNALVKQAEQMQAFLSSAMALPDLLGSIGKKTKDIGDAAPGLSAVAAVLAEIEHMQSDPFGMAAGEDPFDSSTWLDSADDQLTAVEMVIAGLEDQQRQLSLTADAYLEYNLRAEGAGDEQVKIALELAQKNRELREEQGRLAGGVREVSGAYSSLGGVSRGVMHGLLTDADSAFSGIADNFSRLLANMADDALRNSIEMQFTTASQSVGGADGGGDSTGMAGGAVAAGGWWAVAAVAAVAAVGVWNDSQADEFAELTAEVRQGAQGTGTVLGALDAKSQSLNNAIGGLSKATLDALGVNHSQLRTLQDIRTGLAGVAAGFSRTGFGSAVSDAYAGVDFDRQTPSFIGSEHGSMGIGHRVFRGLDNLGMLNEFDSAVTDFMDGISSKITGELWKEKIKLTDSGIEIFGGSLKDIIAGGLIDAQAYADITREKKVFGISLGKDLDTGYEQLDDRTLGSLSNVFADAGQALERAASDLGIDFGSRAGQLLIDGGRLSLMELTGDELTDEIESFFSATLDRWGDVLLGGTTLLDDFQQDFEGAFETVLRLSSQTAQFADDASRLGLNFDATGEAAVRATQQLAEAAGGYDALGDSLGMFTRRFVSDAEQLDDTTGRLNDLFGRLGADLPNTRQGFKDLVTGIDTTTESGAKLFTTLVGISGPMADYLDALQRQSDLYDGKMVELLTAQGDAAGALALSRELELAAMDGSLHAMQERIWALQQEAEATDLLRDVADDLLGIISPAHAELNQLNAAMAEQLAAADALGLTEQQLSNMRQLHQLQLLEFAAGLEASIELLSGQLFGDDIAASMHQTAFEVDRSMQNIRASMIRAIEGVSDWLNSSMLSDVSPLTPQERMAEAEQQFNVQFAAAMGGDTGAMTDLPALADMLLSEASGFFGGSTQEFDQIWMQVRDAMGQVAGLDIPAEQPTFTQQASIVAATESTAISAYEQLSLASDMVGQIAALSRVTQESPADIATRLGVPIGELLDIMQYTAEDTALALDGQFDSLVTGFDATIDPLLSVQQVQLEVTQKMADDVNLRLERLEQIMEQAVNFQAVTAKAASKQAVDTSAMVATQRQALSRPQQAQRLTV